jgi:hypothetical protein
VSAILIPKTRRRLAADLKVNLEAAIHGCIDELIDYVTMGLCQIIGRAWPVRAVFVETFIGNVTRRAAHPETLLAEERTLKEPWTGPRIRWRLPTALPLGGRRRNRWVEGHSCGACSFNNVIENGLNAF